MKDSVIFNEFAQRLCLLLCALCFVCIFYVRDAEAVQVQDLVRIKGAEKSKLIGMGIVTGLRGTGDKGKYLPAMRNLANAINYFTDASTLASELKDTKNVALVAIEAVVPASGVQEGDQLDVSVSAIGSSKSLMGGRLFMAPLTGPVRGSPVYAYASGGITIEDEDVATVGVIKNGAQMTVRIAAEFIDHRTGKMTFVLNDSVATWLVASNLANLVNDIHAPEGPAIAKAVDPKNVVVDVPIDQRSNPATFIAAVLRSYVDPSHIDTGAMVKINERTGTIIISGDVQISPTIISHKGLTITTVTPTPEATQANPSVTRNGFVAFDPERRGGSKLADLIAAFNQLKVEAKDRITIIKEMEKTGKLHAKVVYE